MKFNKKNLNILSIIDPHFIDKAPGARIDDYLNTIIYKFDQIKEKCVLEKVDYVVITGDLFSDKRKTKNSHFLVSKIISIFKSFPCPIYGILGNHDLEYDQFSSWTTQPISPIISTGLFNLLDFTNIEVTFNSSGKKVLIDGYSYNEDNNISNLQIEKKCDLLIRVTHSPISPTEGKYKNKEVIYSYNQIKDYPPDIFILGHIHTDFGITQIDGKYFVQHGSLMRSSTHDYNLTRDIKVGITTISDELEISCREVILNYEPSTKVFCLEKKRKIEADKKRSEEFYEKIEKAMENQSDKASLSLDSLVKTVVDRDPNRILKIIGELLEEAGD